jgi:copper homeostasis protein
LPLLEICADSLSGALAAQRAGAARLELCSRLDLGGLTPSDDLLRDTLAAVRIPIHAMIRLHGGAFDATEKDFDSMRLAIDRAASLGAAGLVFGLLTPERAIDVDRMWLLMRDSRPLPITFHRAFDVTPDPRSALETLISLGVDRVLTSGHAPTALEGLPLLRDLVTLARGRIVIMAGGGVRAGNAGRILRETGVRELHSSIPFRLPRLRSD